MRRLLAAFFLVFAVAFLPAAASADDGRNHDDFLLKADGSIHVAAGQSVGTLVAIDTDVQIDGTVKHLIAIDANVVVTGQITKKATLFDGHMDMASGAVVNKIDLFDGTVSQQDGSMLTGSIRERDDIFVNFEGFGWAFMAGIWAAVSVAILAIGVMFATVGSNQLRRARELLTQRPAESIAAGIIFWVITPIVAVALLLTLIGIPLGLGVLLVLLPAAWVLGYVVAGYKLGSWMASKFSNNERDGTVLPTVMGLVALQLLVLVPVAGGIVAIVAATWGVGALGLEVMQSVRRQPMAPGLAA